MSWFNDAVTSSVGRKILVALTAIFLILFLVVHAVGNVQLFFADEGKAFNLYSRFMSHNELIRIVEILLFLSIVLHVYSTVVLTRKNAKARPVKYAQSQANKNSSWFSRNMFLSGSIILIFLVVHLVNFWGTYKFGKVDYVMYNYETGGKRIVTEEVKRLKEVPEVAVKDMYALVEKVFQKEWWYSILYVVSMVLLAMHLNHGFQSAFQSLGINHKKYTPLLKKLGIAFSIVIPLLFASMPIYFLVIQFM